MVFTGTTLDGEALKWFSVFSLDMKSDWKRFTQEFSKSLTLKDTNTSKESYAMKFAESQMKQLNNLQ